MKSTLVNPHKPAGRFGSVFEIMAFREMFSQQLNNLYGSNVIQIVKLDGNNNLVLETPPSSQSRNIAEVDFSLPILLYNNTHYDIAEPLPEPLPDVIRQPGSKTRDADVVETRDTSKGLLHYVETIFSTGLSEDREVEELRSLISSL